MLTPEVIEVSLSSLESTVNHSHLLGFLDDDDSRRARRRREMNLGYRLTPGIYPSDASLSLPSLPSTLGSPMMSREKEVIER